MRGSAAIYYRPSGPPLPVGPPPPPQPPQPPQPRLTAQPLLPPWLRFLASCKPGRFVPAFSLSMTQKVARLTSEISSSPRVITGAVFSVGVSPTGPTAASDGPPANDNAPATPNVMAFARLLRFEVCFACDIVETSHIKSDGCGPRAKQIVATHPRLRFPFEEVQFFDGPGRRRAGIKQSTGHNMRNCLVVPALANGRTTMKHFVLSIALLAFVAVAVSTTAQAYYHHRHHHYWHHGGGGATGIIIGPLGRGEVTTRGQLVERHLRDAQISALRLRRRGSADCAGYADCCRQ
jgi:hypothetical protein